MTQEEFAGKFRDELVGVVLASFARASQTPHADNGKFMVMQMAKVEELLRRMYVALDKPLENKPRPTKETLLADWITLSVEERTGFTALATAHKQAQQNGKVKP